MAWKFRSMRTMDDGAVIKQAAKDDPRITPFGAFLRRTSLDELLFARPISGCATYCGERTRGLAR